MNKSTSVSKPIHILYASETGNTQEYAERVAREAYSRGVHYSFGTLDEFNLDSLNLSHTFGTCSNERNHETLDPLQTAQHQNYDKADIFEYAVHTKKLPAANIHSKTLEFITPSARGDQLNMKIPPLQIDESRINMIILVSTTGDGQHPKNMSIFWRRILSKSLPNNFFSRVDFALIAFGDSSYEKYNYAGKRLHRRLLQLGARCILHNYQFYNSRKLNSFDSRAVKLIDGRADTDEQDLLGHDTIFTPWLEMVWVAMGYSDKIRTVGPSVKLHWVKSKNDSFTKGTDKNLPTTRNSLIKKIKLDYKGTVVRNERVTHSKHFQDLRIISIKPSPQSLALIKKTGFGGGSIASLQPKNPPEMVHQIMDILGWSSFADQPLFIEPSRPEVFLHPQIYNSPFEINGLIKNHGVFRDYLDLKNQIESNCLDPISLDDESKEKMEKKIEYEITNCSKNLNIGFDNELNSMSSEEKLELSVKIKGEFEIIDSSKVSSVQAFESRSSGESSSDKANEYKRNISERLVTIRILLTHFLDLSTPPKRHFFVTLFEALADSNLPRPYLDKVKELGSAEGIDRYTDYVRRPRRLPSTVLKELLPKHILSTEMCGNEGLLHPLVKPDYIFDLFPVLRPRQFSISSFLGTSDALIDLTVAIVEYKTSIGNHRVGLCSNWMRNLSHGQEIDFSITPGTWVAPDTHTPILESSQFSRQNFGIEKNYVEMISAPIYSPSKSRIFICAGTGIAPVRAMIQQQHQTIRARKDDSGNKAKILVLFGCRHSSDDNLAHMRDYLPEIDVGSLDIYSLASRPDSSNETFIVSRSSETATCFESKQKLIVCTKKGAISGKYYIDALIEACQEQILTILYTEPESVIYISGNSRLPVLVKKILGHISGDDRICARLSASNRLFVECWS